MIVDGKAIARSIKKELAKELKDRQIPPTLFIVSIGDDKVTQKFIARKKEYANDIGACVEEKHFSENMEEKEIIDYLESIGNKERCGIIVQLPIPKKINTEKILNTIPSSHDVDVLSEDSLHAYREGELPVLPPVVMAIKEILFRHNVFTGNKKVVIFGHGKLVGVPTEIWFRRHGSLVTVIDENTKNVEDIYKDADIIVSGVGKQGIIKPDMLKHGVVLLDAGTSEAQGKLVGDMDTQCAKNASLFTPVPGGIGPITVAMVFKNLLILTAKE